MTDRWLVAPRTRKDGRTHWLVHDQDDRGRPVAEFDDEVAARAHAQRLAEGPFDWDEQEAWQDPDDEDDDDWGAPRGDA
jgi:hypothetical protein